MGAGSFDEWGDCCFVGVISPSILHVMYESPIELTDVPCKRVDVKTLKYNHLRVALNFDV